MTKKIQDLLKSIHRFAAEFYSERGQLLNSSRNYRKERKKRRQEKDAGSDANSSSSLGSESMGNQQKDEESDAEYSNETSVKTKRPKKGRHRVGQLYVDMYKVFDGSAMMALGECRLNCFPILNKTWLQKECLFKNILHISSLHLFPSTGKLKCILLTAILGVTLHPACFQAPVLGMTKVQNRLWTPTSL